MKIVHLSDLHFGTHSGDIVESLYTAINDIQPQLVVISGDFTQHASHAEFRNAAEFIKNLNAPCFCVPGNHDIPGANIWRRFADPYRKYQNYISEDLAPVYQSDEIVLAGVNTTRRFLPHWNWANGAISLTQCKRLEEIFDPAETRWTICTLHHPIHKVDDMPLDVTVFGKQAALETIHSLKIDLVLTGHVHHASITTRSDDIHQSVYLSASTTLSSRLRGQENGLNVITLSPEIMKIDIFKRLNGVFSPTDQFSHRRR